MTKQYLKQAFGTDTVLAVNGVALSVPCLVSAYPAHDTAFTYEPTPYDFLETTAEHEAVAFTIRKASDNTTHTWLTQSFTGAHPPVGH